MVESWVFASDGRMLPLRRHLLVENVLNIGRSIRLMQGRPVHGVNQGVGPVFIFECQAFVDALFAGLVRGRQVCEIALGDLP